MNQTLDGFSSTAYNHYMSIITIKLDIDKEAGSYQFDLDETAKEQVEKECQRSGRSRDDVILDIAQRRLWLMEFNAIHKELAPYAEKAGLSEEEILALPRMPAPKSS